MRLYAVALSVEYLGEGIDVRSDTHYAFVQAESDEVAYDLADRLAASLTTDDAGYIAAEATSVGEVQGGLPDLVAVRTADDIPVGD